MSAADVITEVLVGTQVGGGGYDWASVDRSTAKAMTRAVLAALSAAGYVVATPEEIRAWPVEQVAELIGGGVVGSSMAAYDYDPAVGVASNFRPSSQVRVVGPWVEVRDA